MKHTLAQKLMITDGAPAALFILQDKRVTAWANRPLTEVPRIEFGKTRSVDDEATAAFRASEDERKRLKSLAGIARMKTRFAIKAIDHSKMRWDPRKAKFVADLGAHPFEVAVEQLVQQGKIMRTRPEKRHPNLPATHPANRGKVVDPQWSRVTKDTARELAELNGVWDNKYTRLSGGLLVMTVTNRLKGLVKKGGGVKWQ